jgi:hypothetical protein
MIIEFIDMLSNSAQGGRIKSQIWGFGDLSDEITSITGICEYILRAVDICIFCRPRFLPAWLSQAHRSWESILR